MRRKPWRKLLWVRQDYPDSWVDASFLQGLERNRNVQAYDYWRLAAESAAVTQHLCTVALFVTAFAAIYTGRVQPPALLCISALLALACARLLLPPHPRKPAALSALVILATVLGLAPILKSLSRSTASDSIWALAFALFAANILLHDYTLPHFALATNAAITASVVLASRLPSTLHVFSLTLFAVVWFALVPFLRASIKKHSLYAHLAATLVLAIASLVAVAIFSLALSLALALSFLFVSFLAPLWLISLQQYKNEIHGPWDVARPKFNN